jgi:CBS domain-containing protein
VGVDESDIELSCSNEEALDPGQAGRAKGRRAETVPVSAIMTEHVICVHPDLPLDELASVLLENGIGGAPVVDVAGRPVGIASKTDLLRWFRGRGQAAERGTVADIMTPLTFVLPAAESIAKAAALMAFEHIHRVPIVAASGQVVGIATSHDLLTWLARSSGYIVQPTTRV